MKKIIIYNVNKYYGGTLVLSALCKELRALGYDARVFFTTCLQSTESGVKQEIPNIYRTNFTMFIKSIILKMIPSFKWLKNRMLKETPLTTMEGIKIQYNPFFSRKNSIIIYPEYQYGNPLYGKNVVRWLLSNYKYEDDNKAYSNQDLFVCYRDIFNSKKLNPSVFTLKVQYLDKSIYKQYNFNERKGNCYILRKGIGRNDLPKEFDGPVIDFNTSEETIVDIFNRTKFCYSYDTQTYYTVIAILCGCIPIVVLEEGKTENDYLGEGEKNHYGIAYGDSEEQIKYAIETRAKRIQNLDYDEANKKSVSAFVKLLENKYGKLKRI